MNVWFIQKVKKTKIHLQKTKKEKDYANIILGNGILYDIVGTTILII